MEISKNRNYVSTILLAGLVAGTLDISAAILQTLINGGNPLKMLQFIASGAFGETAFDGGNLYSFFGLLFHYCIAYFWTVIFFMVYPKIKLFHKNIFLTAIVYGIIVWLVMNLIVLPASNVPKFTPTLSRALLGASILIVAIGLPLAYFAKKQYSQLSKQ